MPARAPATTPERLQAHAGRGAQQYDAVHVPPFTLYFHPSDPLPYLNYAIPTVSPATPRRSPSLSRA